MFYLPDFSTLGIYKPTNVMSISYDLLDVTWPFNYQRRQCNEYLKLGLQGVTLFFSSGDEGVGTCENGQEFFQTSGPSDCPYVVAVGATEIAPGTDLTERAAALSGGGFSLIYDAPKYQEEAIQHYFNVADPGYKYFKNGDYNSTGRYNRNGRGTPDISACE